VGAIHPGAQPATAADRSQWLRWAETLVHGGALAGALLSALVTAALGVWLARSGFVHIFGVDTNVLFTVQKVLLGSPLYTDPAAPPFEIAQYGPAFYLLVALVAGAAGVDAGDGEAVARLGRSVALLISVGIFGITYRIARDAIGAGRLVALTTAAFGFVATSPWYFVARPDGLMALALLTCLYCVLRGNQPEGGRDHGWLVIAGVAAVVAVFAKQNGVSALVIAVGYLALRRDWRAAATVLAAFAAAAVVAGAALLPVLGDFVRANTIDGLDNGVSLRVAWERTFSVFFLSHALLLALLGYVLLRWRGRGESRARLALFVGLGWLFVFSTVTALKIGSAPNYYAEFVVLAGLAIAAFVTEGERAGRPAARAFAGVVSLALLVFLPIWMKGQLTRYWLHFQESHRLGWYRNVADYLRAEIPAGSETLVLGTRAFATVMPERAVIPQPELQGLAYRRGTVDYARFQEYVRDGRIGYVVQWQTQSLYPFLGADFSHFVRVREIGRFAVYAHPRMLDRAAAVE
jgi:hypothetical protein